MIDKFWENISREFVNSELIREELNPLYPSLYSVIETAQSSVPDCIDAIKKHLAEDIPIPPKVHNWLYPSLMRAIMQVLFQSRNIRTEILRDYDIKSKDIIDWEPIILSNNGLAGSFDGYKYRILKAVKKYKDSTEPKSLREKLPVPGSSPKKQAFYCQSHLLQYKLNFGSQDNSDIRQRPNIIFLWDKVNESRIDIYLSCPRYGNEKIAIDYFTIPIQHPALSIPKIQTQDIIEAIDLPLIESEISTFEGEDKRSDIQQEN
jgi:hypothetical protein